MTLTGVSLVLTVGILNIYHHSPSKPVPTWVRNVILHGLATVLCVYTDYVRRRGTTIQEVCSTVKQLDPERKSQIEKHGSSRKTGHLSVRQKTVEYLKYLRDADVKLNYLEQNKEEWVLVGRVLDRACWVILVIILISGLVSLRVQTK